MSTPRRDATRAAQPETTAALASRDLGCTATGGLAGAVAKPGCGGVVEAAAQVLGRVGAPPQKAPRPSHGNRPARDRIEIEAVAEMKPERIGELLPPLLRPGANDLLLLAALQPPLDVPLRNAARENGLETLVHRRIG
jgi:hypothetical protein